MAPEVEQSPEDEAICILADELDLRAATPLAEQLLAARGSPLRIDGSRVSRIGGLCTQVLLAARATWAADGKRFILAAPSPALLDGLTLLGAASLLPRTET